MREKIFGNTHLFAFVLCLLFSFVQSQAGTEICNSIGQTNANVNDISLNTPISINQGLDDCVEFFRLSIRPGNYQANQYLFVEVTFTTFSSDLGFLPRLLGKIVSTSVPLASAIPQIKFTSSSTYIDADYKDDDGFMNRKTYHNIVIDPSKVPTNGDIYFAMYKYFDQDNNYTKVSVDYTVKATFSPLYPCPQDCSGTGQGTCTQSLKQCVCNTNYYGLDCSVIATELKAGKTVNKTIDPAAYKYFYINLGSDPANDLIFTTKKKNGGNLELLLLFSKPTNFSTPNFFDHDGYATIALSNIDQSSTLQYEVLKSYAKAGKTRLMLAVYNYDASSDAEILLSLASGDGTDDGDDETTRNAIMYAMIGIASVLIILWSIFSVIKYKIYREAEAIRRQHQEQQQQREVTYLTKEELDKYFPKTAYSGLQSSFSQNMCSICLDDFQKDTVCRQLTCEHVFNDTCIEAWLANHDSCPNCKKEMTVSAIEAYLKAKKNKKSGLNKIASIHEHDEKINNTDQTLIHVAHPPTNVNTFRGISHGEALDLSHAHMNPNDSHNFQIYRDTVPIHDHTPNPDMVVDITDGTDGQISRQRARRVNPQIHRIQPRLPG